MSLFNEGHRMRAWNCKHLAVILWPWLELPQQLLKPDFVRLFPLEDLVGTLERTDDVVERVPPARRAPGVTAVVGLFHQDVGVPLARAEVDRARVVLAVAGVEQPRRPDGGHVAGEVEPLGVVAEEVGEQST